MGIGGYLKRRLEVRGVRPEMPPTDKFNRCTVQCAVRDLSCVLGLGLAISAAFLSTTCAKSATFASTASRWGQRIVVSTAVNNGWQLFSADVSQAFLRGMTFEELAQVLCQI